MKLSTPLTAFALLAPAALAASLPACSTTSTTPCSCPSGTSYYESVTFAVIGAAATDVKALISDFFDTAWFGLSPFATQGPNSKPGSTRTANVTTAIGAYIFTERVVASCTLFSTKISTNHNSPLIQDTHRLPGLYQQLTKLRSDPSGSFLQKFEQLSSTLPVPFTSGNGSFSGY